MLHAPTAIRVQHLSHRFGATEVLHDIGFEVGEGEIFGFIGPNGAGKTTTIRAMATLLEPTAGRIEIGGIDVALEPERVRPRIGYMADQAGLYPKLTLDEFLAFFAAAYRLPAQAVDTALDLTGLTELRDELSGNLSKGMRQRLQLAKTLLHDPAVLILDEPASDLDPRARIALRDLLLYLSWPAQNHLPLLAHPDRAFGRLYVGGDHRKGAPARPRTSRGDHAKARRVVPHRIGIARCGG